MYSSSYKPIAAALAAALARDGYPVGGTAFVHGTSTTFTPWNDTVLGPMQFTVRSVPITTSPGQKDPTPVAFVVTTSWGSTTVIDG